MDSAGELGKLREQGMAAYELYGRGEVEAASETLANVVNQASDAIAVLRRSGAHVGVTLPLELERANALIFRAYLDFGEGDSEGVASSLGALRENLSQTDLDAVADLVFGRCVHNRITSDDNRCQASPPC